MKWIPVDERLPNKSGLYVVSRGHNGVMAAIYYCRWDLELHYESDPFPGCETLPGDEDEIMYCPAGFYWHQHEDCDGPEWNIEGVTHWMPLPEPPK